MMADVPAAERLSVADHDLRPCPYPGLRPFSEREARLFFGRRDEIGTVVTLLEDHQLVVIHGASGCGKSSLIRAGVVPMFRLDALATSREAHVILFRPGDAGGPLVALAEQLDRSLPRTADAGETPTGATGPCWADILSASPDWGEAISAAAEQAGVALCIVVDQFEEIFAAVRTGFASESARLVRFLIGLDRKAPPGTGLGERPLSVLLTMRSDYLGHCAIWEGFAETVNRCQYLLPKMSTVGMLHAIHEPARLNDAIVAESIVDQLLAILGREIDGLPILQHALMRAWQHGAEIGGKWVIDEKAAKKIGGIDKALSRHADDVASEATDDDAARVELLGWIFRSLADLDTDNRIIRRSVSLARLAEEAGADIADVRGIVEIFRRPENSLLSPYPPDPLDDGSIVTVSHEALLRQWTRITDDSFSDDRPNGLVFREFQDGLIWRALAVQAEQFGRNAASVLSAAATEDRMVWYVDIANRPKWAARYAMPGVSHRSDRKTEWELVADLMAASRANLEKERGREQADRARLVAANEEKLSRERENRSRLKKMSAITVAVIAATFTIAAAYLQKQTQIADTEKNNAIAQKLQTVAYSQALKFCWSNPRTRINARSLNECVADNSARMFKNITENGPRSVDVVDMSVPQSPYGAGGFMIPPKETAK